MEGNKSISFKGDCPDLDRFWHTFQIFDLCTVTCQNSLSVYYHQNL